MPSLSVTARPSTRADGLCPDETSTPCDSCSCRMKRPTSGPITRSSGWLSGATTCTSSPRARSEAATSRPMKLAPTTTTRFAAGGSRDDRLAVGKRPQVVDLRLVGARECPAAPVGAGGDQQRAVARRSCAVSSATALRLQIERRRPARSAPGRCGARRRTRPSAAESSRPARFRRDNPSTGSAGRTAARRRR